MSGRYLEILSRQRPFPFNIDEHGRVMFSCNYDAMAAEEIATFEEDIVLLLTPLGLTTLGVDTFIGPAAVIPAGVGPFITIIDTGGAFRDETHNGDVYERLSCQIAVRARSFVVARERSLAIWRALSGLRNITAGAPSTIVTEGGDTLVTEGGDTIVTEGG